MFKSVFKLFGWLYDMFNACWLATASVLVRLIHRQMSQIPLHVQYDFQNAHIHPSIHPHIGFMTKSVLCFQYPYSLEILLTDPRAKIKTASLYLQILFDMQTEG